MIWDVKNNLKLIGNNLEDLKIISAYSQDSIVLVKDMVFLKKNRVFVMMLNRFMWENMDNEDLRSNKRVRCAIKFDGVLKVKSKRINQKKINKSLICMAVECNEISNENYEVKIFFSGDSMVTLILESLEVVMQDLGAPWGVKNIPKHKI